MNLNKIDGERKISVAALEHDLEVFTAYINDLGRYKTANVNYRKPTGKMHPYYEIIRDRSITWVSLVEFKPKYPTHRDDLKSQIEDLLRHLAIWSDRSLERRLSFIIKFDQCNVKGGRENMPELYDRAYLLLGDKELTRGSRNKLSPQDITDYLQIHFDFGTADGKVIAPESTDPLREFLVIGRQQSVHDFYFSRWLMTELKIWKILREQYPDEDDEANDMRLVIRYDNHVAHLGREASTALMTHRAKVLQGVQSNMRSRPTMTTRIKTTVPSRLLRKTHRRGNSGIKPPRNLKE